MSCSRNSSQPTLQRSNAWLTPGMTVTNVPVTVRIPVQIKLEGRKPLDQRELALFTGCSCWQLPCIPWLFCPHLMIFQEKTHRYTPFLLKIHKILIFQWETDSKYSKTLFRPNNRCLWVEFAWQSAGFPPLLGFIAVPKKAGAQCND